MRWATGLIYAALLLATSAHAQDHDSLNDANNPLTPKITINFHNFYDASLFGLPGRDANQFLFRGVVPWKIGDSASLFRFTVPVATAPTFPDGSVTSLGDTTLMNMWMSPGRLSLAAGPILVIPGNDAVGSGRWQAGAVGVVIAPQKWGILGALLTYQHSFAQSYGRDDVSLLTFQPVINYNLPNQFYIRSSATWTFNLAGQGSYIPVGLGLGRVWMLDRGTTMNTFIEPQVTLWHDGPGAPHWAIFAGINFQFSLGK